MKLKKRKKSSRMRGSHTHGRGFKKKARGSGHRGGKGMAGTGKRADQKKTLILNLPYEYFGKDKALRKKQKPKLKTINIQQILQNKQTFQKDNKINLKGYKILSNTNQELDQRLIITASAASKSAIDKVKKAGGDIIIE